MKDIGFLCELKKEKEDNSEPTVKYEKALLKKHEMLMQLDAQPSEEKRIKVQCATDHARVQWKFTAHRQKPNA